ncbi:MAG: single-stranded-DNA-specific exonuclease RecJ, partial [Faecalimonas sp.]|nr:single-stranded-DNA-specific exonuclease RecJ [Faecalimonas sp.]
MERWFIMRKGAPFQEIAEKFQISSLLARLIRNRDVVGDAAVEEYLNGTLADLHDGILMKDMDKAVDLLQEKLEDEKQIRIIGDYDIDGINATYILLEGFRALGAKVDVDIPDRMKDGYG